MKFWIEPKIDLALTAVFRLLKISLAVEETLTNYDKKNWFFSNSNFSIYTVIIFRSRLMIFQSF